MLSFCLLLLTLSVIKGEGDTPCEYFSDCCLNDDFTTRTPMCEDFCQNHDDDLICPCLADKDFRSCCQDYNNPREEAPMCEEFCSINDNLPDCICLANKDLESCCSNEDPTSVTPMCQHFCREEVNDELPECRCLLYDNFEHCCSNDNSTSRTQVCEDFCARNYNLTECVCLTNNNFESCCLVSDLGTGSSAVCQEFCSRNNDLQCDCLTSPSLENCCSNDNSTSRTPLCEGYCLRYDDYTACNCLTNDDFQSCCLDNQGMCEGFCLGHGDLAECKCLNGDFQSCCLNDNSTARTPMCLEYCYNYYDDPKCSCLARNDFRSCCPYVRSYSDLLENPLCIDYCSSTNDIICEYFSNPDYWAYCSGNASEDAFNSACIGFCDAVGDSRCWAHRCVEEKNITNCCWYPHIGGNSSECINFCEEKGSSNVDSQRFCAIRSDCFGNGNPTYAKCCPDFGDENDHFYCYQCQLICTEYVEQFGPERRCKTDSDCDDTFFCNSNSRCSDATCTASTYQSCCAEENIQIDSCYVFCHGVGRTDSRCIELLEQFRIMLAEEECRAEDDFDTCCASQISVKVMCDIWCDENNNVTECIDRAACALSQSFSVCCLHEGVVCDLFCSTHLEEQNCEGFCVTHPQVEICKECVDRRYIPNANNPCGVECYVQNRKCVEKCGVGFEAHSNSSSPFLCVDENATVIESECGESCVSSIFSGNSGNLFVLFVAVVDLGTLPKVTSDFTLEGAGASQTTVNVNGNPIIFETPTAASPVFSLSSLTLCRTDAGTATTILHVYGNTKVVLTLTDLSISYNYDLSTDAAAPVMIDNVGRFVFQTVTVRRVPASFQMIQTRMLANQAIAADGCVRYTKNPALLITGSSGKLSDVDFENIDTGALHAKDGSLELERVKFTGNKISDTGRTSRPAYVRDNAYFRNASVTLSKVTSDSTTGNIATDGVYNLFFTADATDNTTYSYVPNISILYDPLANDFNVVGKTGTFEGTFVSCNYAVNVYRDGSPLISGGTGAGTGTAWSGLPLTYLTPSTASISLPDDSLLETGVYSFEFVYTVGTKYTKSSQKYPLYSVPPVTPVPPYVPCPDCNLENEGNNNIVLIVVVSVVMVVLVAGVVVLFVGYRTWEKKKQAAAAAAAAEEKAKKMVEMQAHSHRNSVDYHSTQRHSDSGDRDKVGAEEPVGDD